FNARLRDELLDGEIFYTLREAEIVIESWRRHYNTVRPHASIGYRAPAPEVFVPALAAWPAAQPRPAPPAMLPLVPRSTLNQHLNRTTNRAPITNGISHRLSIRTPRERSMENSACVAILLATYNGEKFLEEQLRSILAQTYRDFVVVVRDDHSNDRTPAILAQWSKAHPDKIYLVSDARGNLHYVANFSRLMEICDTPYF